MLEFICTFLEKVRAISGWSGKYIIETSSEEAVEEEQDEWLARIEKVLNGLNQRERQVLELIGRGERKRSVFAEVVGLGEWPEAEQRKEINRIKQRLLKRLRRKMIRK